MNLRVIGFVDVSIMTANLLLRHRDQLKDGGLTLREDNTDKPIMTNFKSARGVLARIKRAVEQPDIGSEIVRADIACLAPGDFSEWQRETSVDTEMMVRVHCCLVPCPGAWLYCGGEAMVAPVGQLVILNHRALHSEANFGMNERIHLVVDIVPKITPE